MQRTIPVALTIAGSDSGGGAGIQADLKTFAALGVHGVTALAALTAQNPRGVKAIHPCPISFLRQQLEAIDEELPPAAIKIGMLFRRATVRAVAAYLADRPRVPVILDPVMVASSGAGLLQAPATVAMVRELFPLATLITPNLDEASRLVRHPIRSVHDLRAAARELFERHGTPALVKGGHLAARIGEAIDFFYDGRNELMLRAPAVPGGSPHGTGCTYAAAIAAFCARGDDLLTAVERGKNYVSNAIAQALRAGRCTILNHLPQLA